MSQPRQILPGSTYLFTRRILRRHLLFRPDAAINQLILYALAVSALRYGVQVHALCAMSTHLHLVVTDTRGVLPRFLQHFHRIVALGTKVLRRWEGPVWEPGATSVVKLVTPAALVEKIAYVLANPVAAGLVWDAREWPGAKVAVEDIGRGELRAARPTVYLDPDNPAWPEHATLPITLPPTIEADSAESFRRAVAAELERQQAEARAEAKRRGHRFAGAKRVAAVSPYERATSFEALRDRNPTFAVGRQHGDDWRAAAAAVRAFRASYRAALERWRAGVRDVFFPVGTWWMRAFHGAEVNDLALAG
jgi:REP element-mobilizing transposase RayT